MSELETKHISDNRLSRFLSYVLRHHPEDLELEVDEEAYVPVSQLLENIKSLKGVDVSFDQLYRIVQSNEKQRFQFSYGNVMIRAVQGHSFPVTITFEPVQLVDVPEYLYHGTSECNVRAILISGISKMGRHHVHLSRDAQTAWNVANRRRGPNCVVVVNAHKLAASGFNVYKSVNGVYLVDHVMPEFIAYYDSKLRYDIFLKSVEGVEKCDGIDTRVDYTPVPKPARPV